MDDRPVQLRRLAIAPALAFVPALVLALGLALGACVSPDPEHVSLPPSTTVAPLSATISDPAVTTTDPVTGEAPPPDAASRFVAVAPTRVYDSGPSAPNCAGSLPAGTHTIELDRSSVDQSTTALVVNVAVTDAAGAGEVTVARGSSSGSSSAASLPSPPSLSSPPPAVASLPSLPPAVAVSGTCDAAVKLSVVPLNGASTLTVTTTVTARVAVDIVGRLDAAPHGASAGRLVALAPTRLLDTGISVGATGPLPAGGEVEVTIAGSAGVPAGTAAAAVVQLTATDGKPPGTVTVWASGATPPPYPTLALSSAGWAASNLAIVPLSAQGKITLQTSAETNLIADVVGFVTGPDAPEVTDGLLVPTGARLVDTRDGATTAGGPLEPGFRRDLTVAAPAGTGSALLATFAPAPTESGAITAYAGNTPRPGTPTVPIEGAGVPSVSPALVRLGDGSTISLTTDAPTDLVVDNLAWVLGNAVPRDPTVPASPPTPQGTPVNADFDTVVNSFLAARGLAGATVAVAKDGQVVYARAYGTMDAAGTPVRVDTRFRFASISKVITAAAVLQLVQAGALSLDDSIFSLLSDRLPFGDNPDPRIVKITVRDLLHHTSGFTKSTDPFFTEQPQVQKVFGPSGPKSCLEAAKWFITLPLVGEPGRQFAYVNMNYCLLSLLVEKVTNEPYDTVVQSLVLERRNVRDARIGTSFSRKPDEVAYPAAGGTFLESLAGAGGWLGTSVDLVRFLDGLDPSKPGQHLLRPETYAQMTAAGPGSWGLGVEVFDDGSWGHTGSLAGARAMAMHRPDGITWAVVVNGTFANHNEALRDVMARALTTTPTWPALDYSPELP